MHEVLVNRLGGLSLPRKSVVRLTDRPDMTLDVYRGRKTTIQYTKLSAYASVKLVHVRPITLYCMMGFENHLAQMIIMTRRCVPCKNHVTRLKVKVTVCT